MTAKSVLESAQSGTAPGTMSQAATTDDHIKAALGQLDPANDDHWTADGKPAMAALNALLPAEIKRERLEEVAPNFVRPTGPADAGSQPPVDNEHVAEGAEQFKDTRTVEERLTALERDMAFLRNQFGWPTKDA